MLDRFLFGKLLTAKRVDLLLGAKLLESVQRCFNNVCRIVRAERLGENILDTGCFDNSANSTTSDETGSGRSRAKKNAASTVLSNDTVRNGVFGDIYFDHLALGSLTGFLDTLGNFLGLAESKSDLALAIATDDERAKAETTTTFDYLGTTVDVHDFLKSVLKVFIAGARCVLAKNFLSFLDLVGLL